MAVEVHFIGPSGGGHGAVGGAAVGLAILAAGLAFLLMYQTPPAGEATHPATRPGG